ncbi:alpha/beta hydrolase [Caballeronia sp. dw_276]|jgi:pimeloyl-ACP methyl ester carboxylesterase|uniref:alpha/beta fold hydrolase n=1 Tax=Caballeronia sp. dw_276 TaxID=2719795 RepID=UPI001BD65CA1|nr:alpha/beta hydrolase [Caballeronia sp. dw_276]
MSAWILLRGLTREGRHWGKFLEHLRLEAALPSDQITLLDLPGNGRENALPAPLYVSDMTTFVRSRAAAAGLKPPYRLLAMSLGGMVATDWAQRHPQDIERLVLINTSMRPFAAMHERLQLSAWPQLLRAAALWNDSLRCEGIIHGVTCNRTDTFDDDLAVWATIRRVAPVSAKNALRQLWAAARFHAGEQAPACPTLLLSSKMDHLVKAVCSERIAEKWRSQHKQHAWAGHDLPHDDPAWTANAIAGWLQTLR